MNLNASECVLVRFVAAGRNRDAHRNIDIGDAGEVSKCLRICLVC
jgi:hypothetical protein